MGTGTSHFGLPTNPRVEQADVETRNWQKRMEIDTPSLIKLSHGTIRYREPVDHRKPKLPRVLRPHEAPHHGPDRVGKTGYFYHPKLTDFSSSAAYTKEEAAKFHYVQEPPTGAKGHKVFFVVGVGMPEEILPPEPSTGETKLESMEEETPKEGEEETAKEKEQETAMGGEKDEEKKGEEGEEGEKKREKEGETKEEKEGEKMPPKEESPSRDSLKPKEFRGELVPVSRIPRRNELPVHPERIRIISRAKDQLYYAVEFCEPVSVDVAKNEARERMFLAQVAAEAEKEKPSTSAAAKTPQVKPGPPKEAPGAGVAAKTTEKDDGILLKIVEESEPPVISVVFRDQDTVADIRKLISAELKVSPTKINLLHEEKYVSSFAKLSTLEPAEVNDGFRHNVLLRPM